MPHLTTHFLIKAMVTSLNLSTLVDRLSDGSLRDIPPLFEQVMFSSIEIEADPELNRKFYVLPEPLQTGLLKTLAILKDTDPLIALITAMNTKDRLNAHTDKEQGKADPAKLVMPLLDGLAELSACEDIPPALRAKSFISLLNDPLFSERESSHLSSVRSALRLCEQPLQQTTLAELAISCINGARGYIGKYGEECEAELNADYADLAGEAVGKWQAIVETMPTHTALAHLQKIEINTRWDEFERVAASVASIHYQAQHTHTSHEGFRDALARLPAAPKAF